MALRSYFYYGTTKKIIVAFASIFNGVVYQTSGGDTIQVPLHYSPKEKFIDEITQNIDLDETTYDTVLPRMGFEITGIRWASNRNLNPLSKIQEISSTTDSEAFMLNRVPYDINFGLYLAVRYFEDSLKIVEQIIPYFTPELTLTINDMENFNLKTNIPITLNTVSYDIQYEGSFDKRRKIVWELGFTAKAYYYSNTREQGRIQEVITNMHNADFDDVFDQLTSTVENLNGGHVIVDANNEIVNNPPQDIPVPDFDANPGDFSGQDIFNP